MRMNCTDFGIEDLVHALTEELVLERCEDFTCCHNSIFHLFGGIVVFMSPNG